MTNQEIGQIIKELRISRGLTIRGLDRISGVSFTNIGKLERGEYNPSVNVLNKLLEALGAEFIIREKITKNNMTMTKETLIDRLSFDLLASVPAYTTDANGNNAAYTFMCVENLIDVINNDDYTLQGYEQVQGLDIDEWLQECETDSANTLRADYENGKLYKATFTRENETLSFLFWE